MSLLVLLLVLTWSFAESPDLDAPVIEFAPWIPVRVNGNEGVILPRDAAPELVAWDDPIDGYWLPGEEWLARAEDAVAREAAGIADKDRKPVIRGYRQYAGFIANGERLMFISSMCSPFDNWRNSVIVVSDGGPCYWHAVYNVDTDELESLTVNGRA